MVCSGDGGANGDRDEENEEDEGGNDKWGRETGLYSRSSSKYNAQMGPRYLKQRKDVDYGGWPFVDACHNGADHRGHKWPFPPGTIFVYSVHDRSETRQQKTRFKISQADISRGATLAA